MVLYMLKSNAIALRYIHIATVIASDQGVSFVQKHMPAETNLWVGAVDSELTPRSYIVPGLDDAGDLAYGSKE